MPEVVFDDEPEQPEIPPETLERMLLGGDVVDRIEEANAARKLAGGGDSHSPPLRVSERLRTIIGQLKSGGMELEEAINIINGIAYQHQNCTPVDAAIFASEIWRTNEGRTLPDRIADFILTTQGWFEVKELDKECRIGTKKDRDNRRQVLHRLGEKNLVERHPTKNGLYRRKDQSSPAIDWETADISGVFPLSLPFELENYALLYPRNIAVVTGSPDAGKTAFLLDIAKRNRDRHQIHYYSSEMAETELKVRLSKHDDIPMSEWKKIDFRERSSHYADVIARHPDDLNIIDYFEFSNAEFYTIANELKAIYDASNRGVTFVALQKKRNAELGRGAEFGLEKPRLYLSMDTGVLKIIKAKNWAVEGMNPNGQEFHFSLIAGAKFVQEGAL